MNRKRKFAVFTMDMENFSDTGCIHAGGIHVDQTMLDGVDEYLKLLEKHRVPATLFAMCEAAESIREKITGYLSRGHSLALHGYDHTAPTLMDAETFRTKTAQAKQRLEDLFHTKINGYRAPFFSLDDQRMQVLAELGFWYDSSQFDFPRRVHAAEIGADGFRRLSANVLCRDGFYEFGMNCERWMGLRVPVSGGGYARMANWAFFSSVLYNYLAHNNYYVFYLHPFELSKEKMPSFPQLKKHDQYYLHVGRLTYAIKIDCIIRMLKRLGYEFVTFDQLAERLEKDQCLFG